MLDIYLIILLFNILIGWLSVTLFINLLFFNEKKIKKSLIQGALKELNDTPMLAKIEAMDLADELEPLIEQPLDGLLNRFREETPMIGFLLTPDVSKGIKAKGKEELMKALPEIKAALLSKVRTEFNLQKMVEDKINRFPLKAFVQKEFKKELLQMKWLSALLALGIGLIEVTLLYLLSSKGIS